MLNNLLYWAHMLYVNFRMGTDLLLTGSTIHTPLPVIDYEHKAFGRVLEKYGVVRFWNWHPVNIWRSLQLKYFPSEQDRREMDSYIEVSESDRLTSE